MEMACEMQGINTEMLQAELEMAIRTNQVSNYVDFYDCDTDFVIDYIINVHHGYLGKSLSTIQEMLADFVKEHARKFNYLNELETQFETLVYELTASVKQQEEVIFPYIRHLVHAHKHKEPYAALLIKTLRKPLDNAMFNGHEIISGIIMSIRRLTNSYAPPEKVCISHKVVLAKLKELDNDLMQHLYLEQSILFPRIIAIEKELMDK
jgi:regulator of cell morphogenesis and NO signaling